MSPEIQLAATSTASVDGAELFPAIVIPEPKRGFRFGLGAMMLLTAVFAVQFALISYLGVWAAMAVPPLICTGLLLVVLTAEVARRSGRRIGGIVQLEQRTKRWAFIYIFLLGVSAYLAGGAQLAFEQVVRFRLESRLQRDLGFTCDLQYTWREKGPSQAIVIRSLESGGAMEQAGFQNADIIVSDLPPAGYFDMLDENRGKEISVTAATAPAGVYTQPLEKYPQRQITLVVPE